MNKNSGRDDNNHKNIHTDADAIHQLHKTSTHAPALNVINPWNGLYQWLSCP